MSSDVIPHKIVVLGLDRTGRPHAAQFEQADLMRAKRAAELTGLHMITVEDAELLPIAAALPQARMLRGNAIVPAVAADVYAKLAVLIPAKAPETGQPDQAPSKKESRAKVPQPAKDVPPRLWNKLAIGDVVLGCKNGAEGWWPVIVLAVLQGDRLRVRWRDYDSEPPFTIRRQMVAFMHPTLR